MELWQNPRALVAHLRNGFQFLFPIRLPSCGHFMRLLIFNVAFFYENFRLFYSRQI